MFRELVARFHLNLVKRRELETEIKNAGRFIVKLSLVLYFVVSKFGPSQLLIIGCTGDIRRVCRVKFTRKVISVTFGTAILYYF